MDSYKRTRYRVFRSSVNRVCRVNQHHNEQNRCSSHSNDKTDISSDRAANHQINAHNHGDKGSRKSAYSHSKPNDPNQDRFR